MAEFNEALRAHTKLSDAVDLEVVHLAVHIGKEHREVLRDLLVTDKVLGIVTCIELGH